MNISSLDDLRKRQEEEGEKRQEFFAGGTDQRGGGSGLSVIGPEHVQSSLERIMGRAERSAEVDTANSKKLTIYRNGIVINDGEFLSFEDERNRNLLRDLERGEVPRALRSGDTSVSGPVDVVIDDKHEEEYRAPAYVAFSGESKTSGAPSVPVGAVARMDELPGNEVVVDTTAPTTTLQIRLSNGGRIRLTLNYTHTVWDLISMMQANDVAGPRNFMLIGGYPPRPIADFTQTLEQAGLLNASITQKTSFARV